MSEACSLFTALTWPGAFAIAAIAGAVGWVLSAMFKAASK